MGQSERLEVCCCCRSKFLDIIGGGVGPDAEEVVDGIFKVIWFLFMLIVTNKVSLVESTKRREHHCLQL